MGKEIRWESGPMQECKDWLQQARRAEKEIARLLEQAQHLDAIRTRTTTAFRAGRGRSIPSQDSRADATAAMIDLEKKIMAAMDRCVAGMNAVTDALSQLRPGNQRALLQMRYISGKSWAEIADELDISKEAVFALHGRALKAVDKIRIRIQEENK